MQVNKLVQALAIFALLFAGWDVPQASAWSVDANFDQGVVGARAQGENALTEAFRYSVFSNEQRQSGALTAKVGIDAGSTGFGDWGGRIAAPARLVQGQEVWLRAYIYFPADFDYTAGGVGLKTLRIHTRSASGSNQGYMDLLIAPNGLLVAGNEIVGSVDKNLGSAVRKGRWEAFEMYIRFDSRPGFGVYRVWQNGNLVYQNTTRKTLAESTSLVDFMYIFSYWNGAATRTQSAYIDSIVFTTDRPGGADANGSPMIGLGGVMVDPPSPPSGVSAR